MARQRESISNLREWCHSVDGEMIDDSEVGVGENDEIASGTISQTCKTDVADVTFSGSMTQRVKNMSFGDAPGKASFTPMGVNIDIHSEDVVLENAKTLGTDVELEDGAIVFGHHRRSEKTRLELG